jgi:hypothetical protein
MSKLTNYTSLVDVDVCRIVAVVVHRRMWYLNLKVLSKNADDR